MIVQQIILSSTHKWLYPSMMFIISNVLMNYDDKALLVNSMKKISSRHNNETISNFRTILAISLKIYIKNLTIITK